MSTQPEYPFFTRFGTFQLTAWLSESVTCDVLMPVSYYQAAHIKWTRQRYVNRQPSLGEGDEEEVLTTREEFMAAYHAAEAFLAAAELEFLTATPVAYCTNEQAKEITRLASHPLTDRRTKTKAILAIPKLTQADAALYIDKLAATIAALEGPVEYTVTGEAFTVKVA